MNNGIVFCLVAGLGFGTWPLIARASEVGSAWITIIVICTTAITVLVSRVSHLSAVPTGRAIGLLLVAGLLNGIGWLAYGRLVASGEFEISRLAPAALILMIAIIAMGGVVIFGETLTREKSAGVLAAMLAAWLLTK